MRGGKGGAHDLEFQTMLGITGDSAPARSRLAVFERKYIHQFGVSYMASVFEYNLELSRTESFPCHVWLSPFA